MDTEGDSLAFREEKERHFLTSSAARGSKVPKAKRVLGKARL